MVSNGLPVIVLRQVGIEVALIAGNGPEIMFALIEAALVGPDIAIVDGWLSVPGAMRPSVKYHFSSFPPADIEDPQSFHGQFCSAFPPDDLLQLFSALKLH